MSVFVFSSPTCAPCHKMKPVFQELEEEFPTLRFCSVNIQDDYNNIAKIYGVTVVPTMVVDSPKGVEKHSGTNPMGYYRILRNATSPESR